MHAKNQLSILVLILLVSIQVCVGQPGDPNGGGAPGSVPISGIEILIAVGALFGVKNLFTSRKNKITKD